MSKRTLRPQAVGTATAPLLYWLALVSGLVGLTMLRMDELDRVVPIWFGGVVGVALGQLLGVLRIRAWTIIAVGVAACWMVGPSLYFSLVALFGPGTAAETAFMVLVPAFICGYASLTERGGLLAFWFPAMLWMLVILEGETPGSFAPRGSLPLVLGLAALFIAFLRARETRRVALWKAHATVGLATPAPRMILRGSPLSGLAQMIWTVGIGGGALLLAGWIAPKLWEKDRELHRRAVMMAAVAPPTVHYSGDGLPCCPDDRTFEREQIREYMPLRSRREEQRARDRERDMALTCSYCAPPPKAEQLWYSQGPGVGLRTMDPRTVYGNDTWPREIGYYGGGFGNLTVGGGAGDPIYFNPATTGSSNTSNYNSNTYAPPAYVDQGMPSGYPMSSYTPPVVVDTPPPPPPPPPPPVTPKKTSKKTATAKAPKVEPAVAAPVHAPVAAKPALAVAPPKQDVPPPPPAVIEVKPSAPPTPDAGMPWRWLFPVLAGGIMFPLVSRITRRQFTLRHLARPFWNESVEQRISNHWQRMLIGLRDAGIQPRKNEQPQAFAKRIGIAGMAECATILERVRHGVRLEDDDLGRMHASAESVVRTSRTRAGVSGRVAAVFRWPLV